jgi:hypothetical protein
MAVICSHVLLAHLSLMRFLVYVDKEGFVLKKEGETWEAKLPNLQAAIKYAQSQAGSSDAKLVLLSEAGKSKLEIEL